MKYLYIILISIIILVLLYLYIPYINIEFFTNDNFLFNTYPLVFKDKNSGEKLGTFPSDWEQNSESENIETTIYIHKGDKGEKGIQGLKGPTIECSGDIEINSISSNNDLFINVDKLNLNNNSIVNFNNKICFEDDKCIDDNFIDKVNKINILSAPALTECQNEKNELDQQISQCNTIKDECNTIKDEYIEMNRKSADAICNLNNSIDSYYKPQIKLLNNSISSTLNKINENWIKKGSAEFDDLSPEEKIKYVKKFDFPLINFVSETGTLISQYPESDSLLYDEVLQNSGNIINITIPQGDKGPDGKKGEKGPVGISCFTNYNETFTNLSLKNIGGPFIRFINQETQEILGTIPKDFPSDDEIEDSGINVITIPLYSGMGEKGLPGEKGQQGKIGTCCPPPPPPPPPAAPRLPPTFRKTSNKPYVEESCYYKGEFWSDKPTGCTLRGIRYTTPGMSLLSVVLWPKQLNFPKNENYKISEDPYTFTISEPGKTKKTLYPHDEDREEKLREKGLGTGMYFKNTW